jgi:DNA-binding NarL/FixJ family response regulator
MIKIMIADDHPIFRKGLKDLLAEEIDIQVRGEAADSNEVFNMVQKTQFDILILDISMPGQSGLEILKQLQITNPDLKVLILSVHPADQYGLRVLKAGAFGFLNKDAVPEEIITAIHRIYDGHKYITSEIAERLAGEISKDQQKRRFERLSDREFEILRLIASGKTPSEIALKLSISVKTVSTYRTRLLDKMNLKNNAELTHYAITNNLVE